MKYYKITNKEEKHYNQQYQDGLNVCCEKWNPSGDCQGGGMYYTDASNILDFVNYGCWIREVELCEDSRTYENPGTPKKWKTDKFILHERRYWCTVEVLEELRQQGASMDNYNILCKASENGHLDVVKYLVEYGYNPDNSDALWYASENGHLDVVKYLVESGYNPDNRDALLYARSNGHLEVVMYLEGKIKENE